MISKTTNLKKTSVAWMPEIPSDWDLKRGKFVFKSRKVINDKMQCKERLGLTLNGVIDRFEGDGVGLNPNDLRTYQIFEEDELVFKLIDLENKNTSRVGYVHKRGIMSSAYIRVLNNPNVNMRYFYFQYFNLYQRYVFNMIGQGVRATMSSIDLLNMSVAIPPLSVQNSIVACLDKKNNEINKFIRNKERLIDLLEERKKKVISKNISQWVHSELKESGISWIGKIPAHWSVLNLKYLLKSKLKYGANEEAKDANLEHPRYIRITDFGFDGKLSDDTFRSLPLKKAKEYLLNEGDILFARSGATVGKTFQFKEYNGLACFAGYLIKASPNAKRILSDFLYLYTQSSLFEEWKNGIFDKATIENIGADKYAVLKVIVPPIEEQEQIIAFVQNESSEINLAISKAQKEISSIKEYREALITDLVTGKRSVPQLQMN